MLQAWVLFHNGEFQKAAEAGLEAEGAGINVAKALAQGLGSKVKSALEQAAASQAMDAMERLDVEMARAELED